jgi:hypothetical protein
MIQESNSTTTNIHRNIRIFEVIFHTPDIEFLQLPQTLHYKTIIKCNEIHASEHRPAYATVFAFLLTSANTYTISKLRKDIVRDNQGRIAPDVLASMVIKTGKGFSNLILKHDVQLLHACWKEKEHKKKKRSDSIVSDENLDQPMRIDYNDASACNYIEGEQVLTKHSCQYIRGQVTNLSKLIGKNLMKPTTNIYVQAARNFLLLYSDMGRMIQNGEVPVNGLQRLLADIAAAHELIQYHEEIELPEFIATQWGIKIVTRNHKPLTADQRKNIGMQSLNRPEGTPENDQLQVDFVTDHKQRHLWIWSPTPSKGKTTFAKFCVKTYQAAFLPYDVTKWNDDVKPNTPMLIIDEYNSPAISPDNLNSICDGTFSFNRKYNKTIRLINPAMVIVLSNKSMDQIYTDVSVLSRLEERFQVFRIPDECTVYGRKNKNMNIIPMSPDENAIEECKAYFSESTSQETPLKRSATKKSCDKEPDTHDQVVRGSSPIENFTSVLTKRKFYETSQSQNSPNENKKLSNRSEICSQCRQIILEPTASKHTDSNSILCLECSSIF